MTDLPHFSGDQVRNLLSMSDCIEAVGRSMRAYSRGLVTQPQRQFESLGNLTLATMMGSSEELALYGIKVITLDPRNAGTDTPVIQGVIALFDAANSAPVATVDAQSVTAMRTAAASAYASKLLARANAQTHGIVGTGVQAQTHALAMQAAFPDLSATYVWGRSAGKAARLVEQTSGQLPHVVTPGTLEAACQCDIVSVVTGAHDPVVFGEMFPAGAHINLVGTHSAEHREADAECIARSKVFVDAMASARLEAGDLLIPLNAGLIAPDHILGEIGQVDLKEIGGRRTAQEVTLYKSVGIFAQDLYTAARVVAAAST